MPKRCDWWLIAILALSAAPAAAQTVGPTVECDLFIAGGGLGGVAAAIEALEQGNRVCLSEISDWLGGQVSAQGVSALDERPLQRQFELFPRGYSDFRKAVRARYNGEANPGLCWVSELCFAPRVGDEVLRARLEPFVRSGQLQLFTDTVVKSLDVSGNRIASAQLLTHIPRDPAQGVNSRPLSHFLLDWYDPQPSVLFDKRLVRLVPTAIRRSKQIPWIVIDATETGELLPLAGVPYRVGTDPRTRWEPSASAEGVDPYCTQGFTYTFVMEHTPEVPLPASPPANYESRFNSGYYSYEAPRFDFGKIFTYRRIRGKVNGLTSDAIRPGDQTMQNWTWGNDWRLSTPDTNLVLTEAQLRAGGQLDPGGWRGGLRPEALAAAEEHALGYFYWLVAGTTDSQLQKADPSFRKPQYPGYTLLTGTDSPMGTPHGLSRYPYIREGRRIIGRPSLGYPFGFTIYETHISRKVSDPAFDQGRPLIYADSVGISQYPIDFHACIKEDFSQSPYEAKEAPAPSYPYQLPLRALIPQKIDNLLAGNKNIATSHITNGSYRVHPIEWAVGAAAGNIAHFALSRDIAPAFLTEGLDRINFTADLLLTQLQRQIVSRGNPIEVPGTTIFSTEWANYK